MNDRPIKEYLAHLLAQANRHLSRHLTDEGVPLDQWRTLKVLVETNGCTMRELASSLALHLPTMTKIIDRMVADALVYRIDDPNDRRKVRIMISDLGRDLYVRQNALVMAQEKKFENSYGNEATRKLREMLESFIREIS